MEWKDTAKKEINELAAVIFPGENGAHSQPYTPNHPNAFLTVVNKTLLEYQIHHLAYYDISKIILVVHISQIENYARIINKINEKLNIKIQIVTFKDFDELNRPKILEKIDSLVKNDFFVIKDDVITDFDLHSLIDLHMTNDSLITSAFYMEVANKKAKKEDRKTISIVGVDYDSSNRIVYFSEHQKNIKSLQISKDLFETYPSIKIHTDLKNINFFYVSMDLLKAFLKKSNCYKAKENVDIFSHLIQMGIEESIKSQKNKIPKNCFVYPIAKSKFCSQITSLEGFKAANFAMHTILLKNKLSVWKELLLNSNCSKDVKQQNCVFGMSVKIEDKSIFKKCIVGDHCFIASGAKIINSILLDHVTVAENVTISDSVILSNGNLSKGCKVEGSIIGENKTVDENAVVRKTLIIQ